MKNTDILKQKLHYYTKSVIDKATLLEIIKKRTPGYTIAEACKRGIVSPLKKWSYYFIERPGNNYGIFPKSLPYEVGAYYCEWIPYAFGGLGMYNAYGFTTQLAERYTIYNTHYVWEKRIGKFKYIFKKVRESFFWWIEEYKDYGAKVLSPERALIQLIKEGWSKEFLKQKPYWIKINILLELASKHASKTLLSNIKLLVASWKNQ